MGRRDSRGRGHLAVQIDVQMQLAPSSMPKLNYALSAYSVELPHLMTTRVNDNCQETKNERRKTKKRSRTVQALRSEGELDWTAPGDWMET